MRNLIRFSEGVNRKKELCWLVRNRKRQTELGTYRKQKHKLFG